MVKPHLILESNNDNASGFRRLLNESSLIRGG
jgi:hypothetical protein